MQSKWIYSLLHFYMVEYYTVVKTNVKCIILRKQKQVAQGYIPLTSTLKAHRAILCAVFVCEVKEHMHVKDSH